MVSDWTCTKHWDPSSAPRVFDVSVNHVFTLICCSSSHNLTRLNSFPVLLSDVWGGSVCRSHTVFIPPVGLQSKRLFKHTRASRSQSNRNKAQEEAVGRRRFRFLLLLLTSTLREHENNNSAAEERKGPISPFHAHHTPTEHVTRASTLTFLLQQTTSSPPNLQHEIIS